MLFVWCLSSLCTAWKVSKYGLFSGPYFIAFGLNTERYGVSLRIQSECGKIRTRKNSVFGHFSRSDVSHLNLFSISFLLCNQRGTQDPPKMSKMESFETTETKIHKLFCKTLHFRCLREFIGTEHCNKTRNFMMTSKQNLIL